MKVWIVLPAYNEEAAIEALINSIDETFREEQLSFEVFAINDGSQDQTRNILNRLSQEKKVTVFHNEKNMGLAETLKLGLLEALKRAQPKDVVITLDADNTHPAGVALRLVRNIREGADAVIASRYREFSRVIGVTLFRRILSLGASLLLKVVFPFPGVRDYTCGYRAYRADVLQALVKTHANDFISARGFSCMLDILLRLREMNAIVTEVPLILRYDRKQGQSKMKVMQTIGETLTLTFKRRLGL